MNRKRMLLAVLAGLLALSVIYAFWAMPRQEKVPPRAAAPRPAAQGAPGKPGPAAADRLNLGLLAQLPQPFPGAGRDIFRFRGAPAPPVAVVPVIPVPAPVPELLPPPPPPPPPTPEQILREKIAGFTFLGFLDRGGVKTVFLSGASELYLVKAGDAFGKDKSLVAREITGQELVVGSIHDAATVRVKLVEKEALMPATLSGGDNAGVRKVPGTVSGGGRPAGALLPSRRSVLQQRATAPPIPAGEEAHVQEEIQPPNENETQEAPAKEGLPGGEGNGQ